MRRILALVALVVGCVALRPVDTRAQCNEACIPIVAPNGARGFGCVVDNDSNAACIARSTICWTRLCSNALITAPTGQMIAMADICGDKVTLRLVAHERASLRVAVQSARAKRAASGAAKSRAG